MNKETSIMWTEPAASAADQINSLVDANKQLSSEIVRLKLLLKLIASAASEASKGESK